jgi:Uncharacterised nucleotidyltransferase
VLSRIAPKLPPHLVVKGIALCRVLYQDVAERPFADVDLRVRPEHMEQLRAALTELGAVVLEDGRTYGSMAFRVEGQLFDVESHIGAPGLTRLRVDDLFDAPMVVTLANGAAKEAPALELHALLLAINLFKDKYVEAPIWAREDTRRIAALPEFSATRFLALAQRYGLTRVIYAVATWLARDGDPAWENLRRQMPVPSLPKLVDLFGQLQKRPTALVTRIVYRCASDHPADWPEALRHAALWQVRERSERNKKAKR